ncbi:MAG: redoxin domain-containing protein [Acidobacteriota bacterium]
MTKRILLVGMCIFTLVFTAFSQDSMKKDAMMKDSTMMKSVTAEDVSKTALNVGAKMPAFTLSDANGKTVSSSDLLKKGNLVVVFYRGAWCPYCNLYLKKLQDNISQIKAQGANIVAISVENPDTSLSVAQKNKVSFEVLSDPKLDTARKFGIVYQLAPETNEKYKGYGIDLVKQNGTETPDLPLSATYIVNQKGEIIYAFLEPDYKRRAEPNDIIETLSKLKNKK